jgi:lipopolysaccharide/colanic/teichoic acid biosynthesis glycosyltransferase
MPVSKRLFDLAVAVPLLLLLLPLLGAIAVVILVIDGRPALYVSERMRSPDEPFGLIKFRTMRASDGDRGVSGGEKRSRITASGGFLRRYRLDELPQLWNVVRGDISLVGPRPPLREYVERFPDVYTRVLRSRPGITGLASIYAHRHEEWLLAQTRNSAETDVVYTRRCIPLKARLDLIYQQNWSLCLDLRLLVATVLPAAR